MNSQINSLNRASKLENKYKHKQFTSKSHNFNANANVSAKKTAKLNIQKKIISCYLDKDTISGISFTAKNKRKLTNSPKSNKQELNSNFAANFHKLLSQREDMNFSMRYTNYLNYKMRKDSSQPSSLNFNSCMSNDISNNIEKNTTLSQFKLSETSRQNKYKRNSLTKELYDCYRNTMSKSNIEGYNMGFSNRYSQRDKEIPNKNASITTNRDAHINNIFGGKSRRQILSMNSEDLKKRLSSEEKIPDNDAYESTRLKFKKHSLNLNSLETRIHCTSNYSTISTKPTKSINKYKYIFSDSSNAYIDNKSYRK